MNEKIKWLLPLILLASFLATGCSDDDGGKNKKKKGDPDPGFSDPHGGVNAPSKLDRPAAGEMPTMGFNFFLIHNELGGDGSNGDFFNELLVADFDLTTDADGEGTFDVDVSFLAEQELEFEGGVLEYSFEGAPSSETDTLPANAYSDGSFSMFQEATEGSEDRELASLMVFEPLADTGAFVVSQVYHEDHLFDDEIVGAQIGINYGFAAKKGAIDVANLNRDYGFIVYRQSFSDDGNMSTEATMGRFNDIEGAGNDGDFCISQQSSFDAFDYDNERVSESAVSHNETAGPSCSSDPGITAKITPVGGVGRLMVEITDEDGTSVLGRSGFAAAGANLLVADELFVECADDSTPASFDCAEQAADNSDIGLFMAIPISDTALDLVGKSYTLHSFSTGYGDPADDDNSVAYEACAGDVLAFADASTASMTFGSGFACAGVEKDDNLAEPEQQSETGDGDIEAATYSTTTGTTGGAITIDFSDGSKVEGFVSADGKLMILLFSKVDEEGGVEATWVIGTLNPAP